MLKTNLDMTVFLSLSSTVKQMTPVFFHLNSNLEIKIQTPGSYRFGDGEWSHSFEYTQTYINNCIF